MCVDTLWGYFEGKPGGYTPAMYCDLFGFLHWTDDMKKKRKETVSTFHGLYKDLWLMDVKHTEIRNKIIEGKLHEFICDKFKGRRAYYFEQYLKFRKAGWHFHIIAEPSDDDE